MQCWKKVLVVAGATLTNCPISLLLYYGNLLPYLASYFYAKRESMTYHVSALWPSAVYCISMPVAMMFTSPLERRLGIKKCLICSQISIAICILSGFFMVEEPLALTFVFGVLQGSSLGASHCLINKFLLMSVAEKGGFATGVMSVGPAFGAFVNICVAHYVINPKNIEADLLVGNTLYFSDPDILRRVPHYFLVSGIFTAVLVTTGIILLFIGSDYENDHYKLQSQTSDMENTIGERHDMNIFKHCDSKNNLIETCKSTYGGCDSASRGDKENFSFEQMGCFSKQNKIDNLKPMRKSSSTILKNSPKESESCGKNKGVLSMNSASAIGKATSKNAVTTFLHLVGPAIGEKDCYLDKEKAKSSQDQQCDKLDKIMFDHEENIEDNVESDKYYCHRDKSYVYENTSSISLNSKSVKQETSRSETKSIFALSHDPSPWETVRSSRFWCIWASYLFLDHAYYIETNLYKQYGQLFISNDAILALTGVLSTVFMTIVRPCVGAFSDRYGPSTSLVVICFLSSLFMNLMVVGAHTSAVVYVVASVIDFAIVTCLIPVTDLLAASEFGKSHYTSNLGLLYSTMISNVMKPTLVSWILRILGWDWLFFSGSILSIVALLIAMLL